MDKVYDLKLPESYEYLRDELSVFLDSGVERLINFFMIDNCDKFKVVIYDDVDEYRKVFNPPYEIGAFAGSFGHDLVRIFADLNKTTKGKLFTCVLHEITHLLYRNYIQEKGEGKRIVWFDEGLASYFSGEHQREKNDDNFKEYLSTRIYGEDKIIPNVSYLHVHGEKFGMFVDKENNSYNGYDWSYLMIRYLIETMSKEELDTLMRSHDSITHIESSIINDTDKYFKNKFKKI